MRVTHSDYSCDRCKAEIPDRTQVTRLRPETGPLAAVHHQVELCPACDAALTVWIEGPTKDEVNPSAKPTPEAKAAP